MKNDLNLLIEAYRQEVLYLEDEMKKSVEQLDFKAAALFQANYNYSREKLRVLERLEDPSIDQREDLKLQIAFLQKWVDQVKESNIVGYGPQKELERCHRELSKLQEQGKPAWLDGDELLICIEKFLNLQISTFDLVLDELVLQISNKDQQLQLAILTKGMKKTKLGIFMSHIGKGKLGQMGFEMDKWQATALLSKLSDLSSLAVLQLLATVIFEGLSYYSGSAAWIRYTERNSG